MDGTIVRSDAVPGRSPDAEHQVMVPLEIY